MEITIKYDTECDKLTEQDKRILRAIADDSDNETIGNIEVKPVEEVEMTAETMPNDLKKSFEKLNGQVLNEDGSTTPIKSDETVLQTTAADDAPRVDAEGIPWDERIHASTKTQTAKGLWKKRRGVDALTIANVENELKGQTGSVTQQPIEEQQGEFEMNAQGEVVPAAQVFGSQPQQQQAPQITFVELLQQFITPMQQQNESFESDVLQPILDEVAAQNNLAALSLPMLVTNPSLVSVVAARLQAL